VAIAATKESTIGPTVNRKNQPIFDQAANRRFKPRITGADDGEFHVQLLAGIPVIPVVIDLAIGGEFQVRDAAHDLRFTLAPALDAKAEFPDQHGAVGVDDFPGDDEARFANLFEHVAENMLDRRDAMHFIERVFEVGIGAVKLGKVGDAFG
jgi:hypothetical protein